MKTKWWTPALFLAPALGVFVIFVLIPILGSCAMSVFDWTRGPQPVYIGLENYQAVLTDPIFWRAFLNNATILIASLLLQLPVAALLALLLSYRTPCRTLFRTAFFAPMLMPTIAIAILWMNLYAAQNGPATRLLQLFLDSEEPCHWLSTDSTSPWLPAPTMAAIFLTICWQYIGFHMVIFMAGLAAIPEDLYEAARIDGATEAQVVAHVVIPSLRPTIAISATLSVIGSLKYFDLIYLMGGALAEKDREVVATYIYRLAFEQGQGRFGQGSAAAVILLLTAAIIVTPRYARRLRPKKQP